MAITLERIMTANRLPIIKPMVNVLHLLEYKSASMSLYEIKLR